MKKRLPLGLVVEGSSSNFALLRLPTVPDELGPVKSATVRVARRLSNFLKAGYAVSQYEDLQAARLILLRVPDSAVKRVVDEIQRSELPFKDLSFLLCATWLTSDVLQPLAERGASVATAVSVPSSREKWFVLEGQLPAMRQVRHFIERNEGKAFEIRPGTKQLYFAAQLLTTALPLPLFFDAQQALRASGITGNHLYALLEEMATEMFRTSVSGARMNWGGPLIECSEETVSSYLAALRGSHPQIAQTVDEQLTWARRKIPAQRFPAGRLDL